MCACVTEWVTLSLRLVKRHILCTGGENEWVGAKVCVYRRVCIFGLSFDPSCLVLPASQVFPATLTQKNKPWKWVNHLFSSKPFEFSNDPCQNAEPCWVSLPLSLSPILSSLFLSYPLLSSLSPILSPLTAADPSESIYTPYIPWKVKSQPPDNVQSCWK